MLDILCSVPMDSSSLPEVSKNVALEENACFQTDIKDLVSSAIMIKNN